MAPRTPVEMALAQVWEEVLALDGPGVEDDFFRLGGESLQAGQVVGRVREVLQVDLPARSLFDGPTIAALARKVEAARSGGGDVAGTRVVPLPRADEPPLSFGQERLWFLDQLTPGRSEYNEPAAWTIRGDLRVESLRRALKQIVRRHQVLRTRIVEEAGRARQEVLPEDSFELDEEDLTWLDEGERDEEARRLVRATAAEPFDLASGRPLRALLVRCGEREWVLLLTLHHIVCDGWSVGVLLGELGELYRAHAGGEPPRLSEPRLQYADYAAWQRDQMPGAELLEHLRYWRDQLAGLDVMALPADHRRPAVRSGRGGTERFAVPAATVRGLRELGRQEGATLFMTMLAALQALLHRWTGQSDVVVGSPAAGRPHEGLEGLIGFFVNPLVLRTQVRSMLTFRELLRRVRTMSLAAYEHQALPFEKLVEELRPPRDTSRTPMFQVMLTLQGARTPLALLGLDVRPCDVEICAARYDLELRLEEDGDGGLSGVVVYSTDLFEPESARRLREHLLRIVDACAANAGRPLWQVELSSPAEKARLDAWNRTAVVVPRAHVHELFAEQAERRPDAIAVVSGEDALTYRELRSAAGEVAGRLRALGAGPGSVVAIDMEPSAGLVATLLGVLETGAAYLPLDPEHPAERRAFVLQDTGAALLLTRAGARALRPCPSTGGDDLAYVIYTSGSTGRPKGVAIGHRALTNLILAMRDELRAGPELVWLAVTSLTFDIAALELFLPLVVGGRVVLPRQARDTPALLRLVADHGVTHLQATPSRWRLLIDAGFHGPVVSALCGGEALPLPLARELRRRARRLWNVYGPTETTIWSTIWPVPEDMDEVSIGRPLANTRLHVLDGDRRPVPIGVPGELAISGDGLSRGYVGRPDLTAERFVPGDGERLYLTGDRVRFRPDGCLEFLGRIDRQVKVRGHRVEPAEVEAVLLEHPGVREAVVVTVETAGGPARLVAYLTGSGPEPPPIESVARHLRERLPEPMVPSALIPLASLPRTPGGKLDRRALPGRTPGREPVAPRNDLERRIARIWEEVLELEGVGVEDSFFDLGGHSLLAQRIHWLVCEQIAPYLPFVAIFQHPTIAAFASYVAGTSWASSV